MKLFELNEKLKENRIYNNFISSLKKFGIENDYCTISLEISRSLIILIDKIITSKNPQDFYIGKSYKLSNISTFITDMDEDSIIIIGNDKKEIFKIR